MRTRNVVAVLVVFALAGLALYWFTLRTDDAAESTVARGRDGKVHAGPVLAGEEAPAVPAPRTGRFARWNVDVDPDGPLRLEGQVVGPDGKGVGSAEVWLDASPDRQATSEQDGTFTFDHLVGKTYTLSASHGAWIGATTYKLTAKSDPVVLRLGEGAKVTVSTIDEDKHPLADVRVVARGSQREAVTDHDGHATLQPVHPGWIVVEASATGFASARQVVTIGTAGATGSVVLVLRKGAAVSGRVVDEANQPIARAHVGTSDPWMGRGADDVETDAQGRFQMPVLAHGVHTLSAVDGVHAPATSPAFVVHDRPVENIEIKMKAGGAIVGIVIDRDHNPVAFATVRMVATGDVRGGPRRRSEPGWGQSRTATTDRYGKFELRGLPRNHLSARAESGDVASKLVEVDLTSVAQATDVQLVLDVSGVIRGVVVDEAAQPVPEVAVHAVPDVFGGAGASELLLAGLSSTTSDGGGNFAISGLPDGSYRLWAQRSSTSSNYGEGTPAHAGDQNVVVVLPATGALTAKLVLAGSMAPPQLASVIVGQQVPTPVDGGTVVIKDLAPGSYDVTFRGIEFATFVDHDIEIKPNQTTDLGTITLPKGRTLTGTVVDTSSNPVVGAKVKLGIMLFGPANPSDSSDTIDDMLGVRNTVSDSDGTFTLTGVPVRQTNVIADHPTLGRSLGLPIAAGTDDPPPVTLVVHGYGSISGKVTSAGQPISGVQVADAQVNGGAQAVFASTSSDGTFVMTNVPEGPQVLTVMQTQLMAMRGTSANVTVVAGAVAQVTIDIPVGTIELDVTVKPLPSAIVNAAQVFLFRGSVQFANGRILLDNFFQSGLEGMKIWLGAMASTPVSYDQLQAATYSLCGIPITGNLTDPKFQQRLQENMELLKVYCKTLQLPAAPTTQAFELDLPAMTPLPPPS